MIFQYALSFSSVSSQKDGQNQDGMLSLPVLICIWLFNLVTL